MGEGGESIHARAKDIRGGCKEIWREDGMCIEKGYI